MKLTQDDSTKEVVSEKEEIKLFYKNMRVLNEVGQQITSTHDFEAIFVKLRESVSQLMDAECFGVRIYHPDNNEVEVKYEYDKNIRTKPFSFSMDNDNNFSVWCIKNKKEIFINDNLTEHKKYVKEIVVVQGEMTESLIFCPMILKDKVIGVLTVQSYKKNQYTRGHLNIIRTLASYAAIALQNARIYEDMEGEVKQRTIEIENTYQNVKLLSEIGKQITSCLSVDKIIETVYENVNQLMDASSFWIGIYNSSEQRLDYPMGIEKGNKLPFAFYDLTEDARLPVWAFKNQKEVFVNDYLKEYHNYIPNGIPPMPVVGDSPESSIWCPLISKDKKTFGILTIQSFQKNSYTEYHLNIVRNLAVFTSIALENALLYEQVEQKVKERTEEVVKKKEEIESTYQNVKLLSEIGQQITSSLSVEKIIETAYENVNRLMDASVFCIGTFNEAQNRLDFFGDMEKGEKLPFNYDKLDDTRLSVWCFNNQKDVIINDLFLQYNNYFPNVQRPKPTVGEQVESVIYLPLKLQEKRIGVISAQSFRKNAYTDYHIDMLKNLAVNVSIALENALVYKEVEQKVKDRTAEVVMQKEELSQKNKDITDSINYALRIQRTILPSEKKIKALLPESFVLFMPKDIVSGDFYWVGEANGGALVVAAVDCTGHGVPGAFLTIVGNNLLNHIINDRHITNPKEIINEMNSGIINRLALMDTKDIRDGMDMAVISLEFEVRSFENSQQTPYSQLPTKLSYSGAYNPLYYVRDNQLMELPAMRYNIGSIPDEQKENIACHSVEIKKGDMIYLFSDGYADQMHSQTGKKFMKSRFKQLLLDIHQKPAEEQKQILQQTHLGWKGELFQTDDILVMGFRF